MVTFATDRYTTFRSAANGALVATEAAGTNKILLPPGEYYVEVDVPAAPTGTSPTLAVSFQEAPDGATWAAMASATVISPSTTAKSTTSGYIRVTKEPNARVTANVTAICTVGGTTPNWGSVFIAAEPISRGKAGFNGQP